MRRNIGVVLIGIVVGIVLALILYFAFGISLDF